MQRKIKSRDKEEIGKLQIKKKIDKTKIRLK